MANPNPSPATRFKPGQSGNPSGRSRKEILAINRAAEISADLTLKAISSLQEMVQDMVDKEDGKEKIIWMLINKDARGLLKEAQDRAHGTPSQEIKHTSPDGSMSPQDPSKVNPDVVAALVEKLTD